MYEKYYRRSVTSIVLSLLLAALVAAGSAAQEPTRPGGSPPQKNRYVAELEKQIAGQESKPAEQVFKNIQLLKGMPASRVLRIMEVAFNSALGVDCTHCHVENQWEKDDREPKQIARKMWEFQGRINRDLKETLPARQGAFVNCTTCHRGKVNPNQR